MNIMMPPSPKGYCRWRTAESVSKTRNDERLLKVKSNNDRYSHFPENNLSESITLQDLHLNAAI